MARIAHDRTVDRQIARQIALWEARRKATEEERAEPAALCEERVGPFIAFSREEGSLGGYVALDVAARLGWDVFGKELVEEMSRKAQVRRTVVESLDERARGAAQDWVASLMDRESLPHHSYQHHLLRVLTTVALHGKAVLIGRGANFVLPHDCGLHVRVTAPLEVRVANIARDLNLSEDEAYRFVVHSDDERAAYVRQHFHKDVAHASHYDLVINTGHLSRQVAVEMVLMAAKDKLGAKPK